MPNKIQYDELVKAGFERHGNWFMKGNVSMNLLSNTLRHTGQPKFDMIITDNNISIEEINDFSKIMAIMSNKNL